MSEDLRQRAERARDHGGGVTLDAPMLLALLDVADAARRAAASGDWNHRLDLDDALARLHEATR